MSDITGGFGEIMISQLNNPECSFLSGVVVGNLFLLRFLLALFVFFILYKALDKLAVTPFIGWLKNKIYGDDKNGRK